MDVKMMHWSKVGSFDKSPVIDDAYILKKLFPINRENKFPRLYSKKNFSKKNLKKKFSKKFKKIFQKKKKLIKNI